MLESTVKSGVVYGEETQMFISGKNGIESIV